MERSIGTTEKNYNKLIYVAGILLAVAVGVIYITPKMDMRGTALDHLPALNALINGTVSLLLVTGYILIRQKKITQHRRVMTSSIVLSALFLCSYVLYHVTHPSTSYGGEGVMKGIYLFILVTHILLAMVIAPLVLISFTRGLSQRYDKHRKIARITLPLWLYVSLTGVIVYLMISPYY